jgi:site-specific recombinase XerD
MYCATSSGFRVRHAPDSLCGIARIQCATCSGLCTRNLAKGTVDFYSKKLNTFLKFCSDFAITNVSDISADNIRQFLIFLDENGHKPAGVHCYYRSVKTFLKWYEREAEPEGWRNPINKVKAPFVPLEPLDPVSIETIRAMMETCDQGRCIDLRDKALLLVLLDTGMRLEEILSLNRDDVDPVMGTILIRSGKGRKPRNVYLGEKARLVLKRYLKQRKDHSPALWLRPYP